MTFETDMNARISDARSDRSNIQDRINTLYEIGNPWRQKVGESTSTTTTQAEQQDDIFDQTLQLELSNFASGEMDHFMPEYKSWVNLAPSVALEGTSQANAWESAGKQWEERLYELINGTNWYEENLEVFHDIGISCGGTAIPIPDATMPVVCRPALMSNILMDETAYNDLDGRWMEFDVKKRHLKEMFAGIMDKINGNLKLRAKNDANIVKVLQGNLRKLTPKGPRWMWVVRIDGETVHKQMMPVGAPPAVNIGRWRHATPSAWGPGPADMCLSAGRILDDLGYINLRKLAKEADAPYSYEVDGVFNVKKPIENGTFVGRRVGSSPPVPMFTGSTSQNVYFEREKIQEFIRACLYTDGPRQEGKTPPTATQWIDEKALSNIRKIARRRIYREYVLPSLRRFAFVFAVRGDLPPIEIGGRAIPAKFISPLSKASDAQEVSGAFQFIQSAVGTLGEAAIASINPHETLVNMKDKLGDQIVELTEPDEQSDLLKKVLQEGKNIA